MNARWSWRRTARGLGVGLALASVLAGSTARPALPALPGFGGGNDKNDACAAERAPILERKRQYDALRRSQIASAVGEGIKKGAVFFAGAMLNKYGLGNLGGQNAQPQPAGGPGFGGGGFPGMPNVPGLGGASGVAGFGGMGALLSGSNLGAASKLQIPGVTLSPTGGALAGAGGDTRAIAAIAVVVAIAGTVEAYVQLKAAAANGDRNRLSQSIDDDAGLQIGVSQAIDAEEKALADCRARQAADLKTHLASASNDSDRRALTRQRSGLEGALKQDVDLTGGVVGQQAGLAKTFTQGRAMSENKSEADVLGSQAPAYEDKASTTALQLPAAAVNPNTVTAVSNSAPAKPALPSYSTSHPTAFRATPASKGKLVRSLAAGATVRAVKDPGGAAWVQVDLGDGVQAYARASDLTRVKTPALAAPNNIREHNREVLQAKADGPNRLKSLLTDVQARRGGARMLAQATARAGRA
jgi:hypothetical protein